MVSNFKKLKDKHDEYKLKIVDQFEGNIYNSRFVFLLMKMKARIKFWWLKKQKEKEIKEKIGERLLLSLGRSREVSVKDDTPKISESTP